MLSKKEPDSPGSKALTVIAEGVYIEGKIYSRGSTRIDGTVNGEIISEKDFTIGKEGKVEANVKTTNAVIAGGFKGEMIASGEVEITATGKFMGNLTQKDALLTIQKGGLLKGQSIISENPDIFKIEIPEKPKATGEQKPSLSEVRPTSISHSSGTPPSHSSFGIRNPIPVRTEQNVEI
ncbi:MAG: polymer-forming cytoskeletal protein [Actinobacteria bacterium]|nr:polymer-forming cytoskeletal protein [Actinomycetota bacterium]MBM3712758.1 polymer-forming cytoskeletal protein [Actinomycetota bacterium]